MTAPVRKQSAKKSTRTKRSARKTPAGRIPIQLAAIAKMVDLFADLDELPMAMQAARKAIVNFATAEGRENEVIAEYITEYAEERGPYTEDVQRAIDVDPGNINGSLHCAFATPAFLAGLCCAYLMLTGQDTEKP